MLGGLQFTKGVVLATALAVSSLSQLVAGIYPDEAGKIDWYRKQIGIPKKVVPYTAGDKRSAGVYAITERNVLASINPANGNIAWRQVFGDNDPIHSLRLRNNRVLTVSGHNESFVRVWDAATGAMEWGYGQDSDPKYQAGSGSAEFLHGDDSNDVVAVAGDSVLRLTSVKGSPVWELPLNGTGSYKRIVVQEKSAFIIGDAFARKGGKPTLHVIEVDLKTGHVIQQYDVASGQSLSSDNLVVLESKDYGGYVVWREPKNIVWLVHRLGLKSPLWQQFHAKIVQMELMPDDMLESTISELDVDPGNNKDLPKFALTYKKDGKVKTVVVEMFLVDGDNLDMRKVVGFRSENSVIASSRYAPSDNAVANQPEFSVASVRLEDGVEWKVYTDNKTPTHQGKFAYDVETYGPITGTSLYYTSKGPLVLIQTSGGLIAALSSERDGPVWFRDEALAHAADMVYVELPVQESTAVLDSEATDPSVISSPFTRYILRWVQTSKSLTNWVFSGFGLLGSSSTAAVSSDPAAAYDISVVPKFVVTEGDRFGFRKLAVVGSSTGMVAALNTQNGVRSWVRYIEDGREPVSIEHVFVTRVSHTRGSQPLVTFVGKNAGGKAVVATLNALTGAFVIESKTLDIAPSKVFKLPAVDPETKQALVGIASDDGEMPKVSIWPSTPEAAKAFCSVSDSFFFDLNGNGDSTQVVGYKVSCPEDLSEWDADSLLPTQREWSLDLPQDEAVVSVTGYTDIEQQRTALLGRILGDRTVLYKYLNPHLMTVATKRANDGGIGVYFVDRVSGHVLYSTAHKTAKIDSERPFLAVQSENQVIYQFWQDSVPESTDIHKRTKSKITKGYVTVVAELFENSKPDTRDSSKTFSSFDILVPHVVTTAFASPERATALGVTSTMKHITTRDVVFGLSSDKVLSLPHQLFDPRRPKKAPSSAEKEEGLVPYVGFLPMDMKRVISHTHSVAGVRAVVSAPTALESTSIVAVFGLDLFLTRTSPSGTFDQLSQSFSKVNLVVTTLVLAVGCVVGGPMVRRKITNQAWQ